MEFTPKGTIGQAHAQNYATIPAARLACIRRTRSPSKPGAQTAASRGERGCVGSTERRRFHPSPCPSASIRSLGDRASPPRRRSRGSRPGCPSSTPSCHLRRRRRRRACARGATERGTGVHGLPFLSGTAATRTLANEPVGSLARPTEILALSCSRSQIAAPTSPGAWESACAARLHTLVRHRDHRAASGPPGGAAPCAGGRPGLPLVAPCTLVPNRDQHAGRDSRPACTRSFVGSCALSRTGTVREIMR